MTQTAEHRYDVTFTASEAPDGRPVIALVLDQSGQAAAGEDHVFFLEVAPAIAHEATPRIADFLTQYVKGFGVMIRNPLESQITSEPDNGNGARVLDPEGLAEDADRRDEPNPNPEEEGQPTPPPQIDGENEAEADEPRGRDAQARPHDP